MTLKLARADSLRGLWLPNLLLPIRSAQPSLVLLAVTASFLIGFSLTFCVGSLSKTSLSTPALPPPPSISALNSY